MPAGTWKALQWLLLALTLAYAVRALAGQWREVRAVSRAVSLEWPWIVLASMLVLLTHALLVQSWRLLLGGWDVAPPFWRSARVWTIANLGRYLPGKVWSLGALGVLARREGVSGVAAASAALLGTLLNIGAGFGIVAMSGSGALAALATWVRGAAFLLSAAFVAGVLLLPRILPPVVNWIARRRGLPPVDRHLTRQVLWTSTGMNVLAWVLYGVAFGLLARGVTPQLFGGFGRGDGASVAGAAAAFITVYTASYLWGYLALFAPGGIVVRELALVAMLTTLGLAATADATFLALASRVWITILEIVPGLLSLLLSPRAAQVRSGHAG